MRKKVVRSLITLCLGLAAASTSNAQIGKPNRLFRQPKYIDPPSWSIGVNFGLTDLWGDVGTKSILDHYNNDKYWKKPMFMGGLYGRYTPHPALGVRLGVNYGTLYASDNFNEQKAMKASSIEDDAYQRYFRNLNVKSNIWEAQLLLEINLRRLNIYSNAARKHFNPYVAFGVGGFHFRSRGEYKPRNNNETQWIDLDKLNLEGQGYPNGPKKYSQWQLNVPLALGLRWDVGKQLALGVEYAYRYCFTDYIDNVSGKYVDPAIFDQMLDKRDAARARDMYDKSWQIDPSASHLAGEARGNSSVKDGYSTISINFYYKIKDRKSPWWY
jgi:opacity protein-like surface antigen